MNNDPYYTDNLLPRIAGQEQYYKKGVYTLGEFKIHTYINHNKQLRITLTINNVIVSGITINSDKTIKSKHTLGPYRGNGYTRQLQAFCKAYLKLTVYASQYQTIAGKACYKG